MTHSRVSKQNPNPPKREKGAPVTAEGIEEYARDYSDFRFEMEVLRALKRLGLGCEHGGTYHDPITNKSREFDIRAWKNSGSCLSLAVECKNITESYPLAVHTVPRPQEDAFHEVLMPRNTSVKESPYHTYRPGVWMTGVTVRVLAGRSVYEVGAPVGKDMDQVGYQKDGKIDGRDSEVFDKFSQAINSAAGLIKRAASGEHYLPTTAIVPVLVVPDGRLWEIRCDSDGNIESSPRLTQGVPYLIRHKWEIPLGRNQHFDGDLSVTYTLSHIELVTLSGLGSMIDRLTSGSPNIFL